MGSEIELKLSLPVEQQQAFAELALLKQYADDEPQVQSLLNCYFDTPDQQLNRHKVALRIRRAGEQFIQTLKTRGTSQGGLHQRAEWEWPVSGEQLELDKLPPDVLDTSIVLDQLASAFNTDFQRTSWQLNYPYKGQLARIELVLDQGQVIAAGKHDPISEIELELLDGPAAALFELAAKLAAEVPLRISRISKAEKGYRLHDIDKARPVPPLPKPDTAMVLIELTERLQALLEAYEFSAKIEQLQAAEQCLRFLQQQLASLNPELSSLLAEQAKALHSLLVLPYDGDKTRAWLHSLALGQSLLRLSQWLFLRRSQS